MIIVIICIFILCLIVGFIGLFYMLLITFNKKRIDRFISRHKSKSASQYQSQNIRAYLNSLDTTHDAFFTQLHTYVCFMVRNMLNDNLYSLYLAYYPNGIIKRKHVKEFVYAYLFGKHTNIVKIIKSINTPFLGEENKGAIQNNMNHPEIYQIKTSIVDKIKKINNRFIDDFIVLDDYYISDTDNTNTDNIDISDFSHNIQSYNIPLQDIPTYSNVSHNTVMIRDMTRDTEDTEDTENTKITKWNDILELVKKRTVYDIMRDMMNYRTFKKQMMMLEYNYLDVTSDIRIWEKLSPFDEKKYVNMIFVDMMYDMIDINRMIIKNPKNTSIIFIEIKGFTYYSEFFDYLTFDMFNKYNIITDIVIDISKVINLYKSYTKILTLCDTTTILSPHIITHYGELFENITLINPMCYPYSFHKYFDIMKNRHNNTNYINMINNISMFDIYMNNPQNTTNSIYDKKIIIIYDSHDEKIDYNDTVKMNLYMHSKVRWDEVM